MWKYIQVFIHGRDNGQCVRCGVDKDEVESLDIHHITPRREISNRHPHADPNLVTLCKDCHRRLSATDEQEQLDQLGLESRLELLISDASREVLNTIIEDTGPGQPILKQDAMEFVDETE